LRGLQPPGKIWVGTAAQAGYPADRLHGRCV